MILRIYYVKCESSSSIIVKWKFRYTFFTITCFSTSLLLQFFTFHLFISSAAVTTIVVAIYVIYINLFYRLTTCAKCCREFGFETKKWFDFMLFDFRASICRYVHLLVQLAIYQWNGIEFSLTKHYSDC